MPGFTKAELTEKALERKSYKWCSRCRLYWSRRGFANHRHLGGTDLVVKFDTPAMPKPTKGDIVIINPALTGIMDALIDVVLRDLLEHPPVTGSTEGEKHTVVAEREDLEYEVLTVDEAVARLGVSKTDVMAAFERASEDMRSAGRTTSKPARIRRPTRR